MDAALDTRPSLTIKRHIKGAPAQVFAAWTDPEKVARWFGPKGASHVEAHLDIRVGGRFRITFRTPEDPDNDVRGTYREVVPGRKLVFTWAWKTTPERESLITVLVAPDGAGTLLTFTQEQFADEAARDAHYAGWMGALDKIEALFT